MKKVYRLQSRTAEKRQHFGIRRLKVGVASIAISASVFLAGNVLAQAEEANKTHLLKQCNQHHQQVNSLME